MIGALSSEAGELLVNVTFSPKLRASFSLKGRSATVYVDKLLAFVLLWTRMHRHPFAARGQVSFFILFYCFRVESHQQITSRIILYVAASLVSELTVASSAASSAGPWKCRELTGIV